MLEPKIGALAICSRGMLGLITDGPKEVNYGDGNKGFAWTGIQLQEHVYENLTVKVGDPWSSRTPKVICYVEDLINGNFRI
jgi:lipoprotein-anchoring transpeptidase ErfK/SrfK